MAKDIVAPNPKDFKSQSIKREIRVDEDPMIEKTTTEDISFNTCPSVKIYGAGGYGVNQVQRHSSMFDKFGAEYHVLDTSKSNIERDISSSYIAGNGSGQVRSSHAKEISKYITSVVFEESAPADINIVMFSLNGGSGSVIGPLLIKELNRLGKVAIAICATDISSELFVNNTYKTLMSLENFCENDRMYLPIMIFNNAVTRSVVDASVKYRLEVLLTFLLVNTRELDKSDRINFFKPNMSIKVAPGLKGFHIGYAASGDTKDDDGEVYEINDGYIFDAVCLVSTSPDAQVKLPYRVLVNGINDKLSHNILGKLGFPVSKTFTSEINHTLNKFETQDSGVDRMTFTSRRDNVNSGGLIL